ncbi:DNA invertase Pin-like site-specific DNA recombinase [Paenarthrobacter nicotinovorans]|uniref:recombinase family protein n=1 Tax=Micrococcaceae TaxID=1268 RepID=UPI000876658C|nr:MULTISPECIES: recombinase family protein [Micrococcaceae]MDR6436058.1 DNA invertase Pin-like site-specific DNA recombinase [Paenarthrobacter nicotinovorans]SCZ51491.1 Site-specific DNA recombinase [Arthrobacter sp. UNCCL28]
MIKTSAPKRVILYLRLSVSKDESVSIANQNKELAALAEREGWEIVATFTDDGLSGGKPREKADKALRMLRDNEADVIAVYKFDRWSRMGARAVADLQDVLDARAANHSPALFIALSDGLRSDSPAWDIQVALMAALGRTERQLIRSRVAAARKYQRSTFRHSGEPAYGYRTIPHPDGKGRALELHPEESAVVRRMVDAVLDGATGYAVAKMLNAEGIKPRRSEKWTAPGVADLLRRDALLGYMTHRRPGENSRTRRPILGEDGLPVQVWPAIVTPEESAQLHAALARRGDWNKMPGAGRTRASRLLSGLVECATCGRTMRVNYTDKLKDGNRAARYVCSAPAGACPAKVSIHADMLEKHLTSEFLNVAGKLDVYEVRESTTRNVGDLAQVEQAIAATAADMAAPGADIAFLAARMAELHARRTALEAVPVETLTETVATGETFAEAWENRDTAGRRKLISSALSRRVVVKPAVKGSRKLDATRLDIPWQWTEPDAIDPAHFDDWEAATENQPNHARERICGTGPPMELTYKPDATDFRRWLLTDAERTVRAEEERLTSGDEDNGRV